MLKFTLLLIYFYILLMAQSDYTVDIIRKILETKDVTKTAEELGQRPNNLFVIRSFYRQWQRTQDPATPYANFFLLIGPDLTTAVTPHPSPDTPSQPISPKPQKRHRATRSWTEDMVREFMTLVDNNASLKDIQKHISKSSKTLHDVRDAYVAWRDRGVEYAGREKIVRLFKQIRKQGEKHVPQSPHHVPVPSPSVQEALATPPPPIHDPFESLNTLIDGFKANLLEIVVQGSLKTVQEALKKEYERGKQEGIEEGFELGKKELESERKDLSFGKRIWEKITSGLPKNEETEEETAPSLSPNAQDAYERGKEEGIKEYRRDLISARREV